MRVLLIGRIGLAVPEATGNVVHHAYGPDHVSGVLRYADIEPADLQVFITDGGHGFRADRRNAGRGYDLTLIAATTSDFNIGDGASGVEV